MIIGSKDYDNGSDNLGKAVVYKFDGANWNQYGLNTLEPNSLKNDNMGRGFGADVSINADGNIIIIGDPDNDQDTNPDSGANQNSGRSHAYKYNANTNLWEKLGWADVFSASNTNTLNRDLDELYSGHSVALNSNGSVAAIGEPQKYEKDDAIRTGIDDRLAASNQFKIDNDFDALLGKVKITAKEDGDGHSYAEALDETFEIIKKNNKLNATHGHLSITGYG